MLVLELLFWLVAVDVICVCCLLLLTYGVLIVLIYFDCFDSFGYYYV